MAHPQDLNSFLSWSTDLTPSPNGICLSFGVSPPTSTGRIDGLVESASDDSDSEPLQIRGVRHYEPMIDEDEELELPRPSVPKKKSLDFATPQVKESVKSTAKWFNEITKTIDPSGGSSLARLGELINKSATNTDVLSQMGQMLNTGINAEKLTQIYDAINSQMIPAAPAHYTEEPTIQYGIRDLVVVLKLLHDTQTDSLDGPLSRTDLQTAVTRAFATYPALRRRLEELTQTMGDIDSFIVLVESIAQRGQDAIICSDDLHVLATTFRQLARLDSEVEMNNLSAASIQGGLEILQHYLSHAAPEQPKAESSPVESIIHQTLDKYGIKTDSTLDSSIQRFSAALEQNPLGHLFTQYMSSQSSVSAPEESSLVKKLLDLPSWQGLPPNYSSDFLKKVARSLILAIQTLFQPTFLAGLKELLVPCLQQILQSFIHGQLASLFVDNTLTASLLSYYIKCYEETRAGHDSFTYHELRVGILGLPHYSMLWEAVAVILSKVSSNSLREHLWDCLRSTWENSNTLMLAFLEYVEQMIPSTGVMFSGDSGPISPLGRDELIELVLSWSETQMLTQLMGLTETEMKCLINYIYHLCHERSAWVIKSYLEYSQLGLENLVKHLSRQDSAEMSKLLEIKKGQLLEWIMCMDGDILTRITLRQKLSHFRATAAFWSVMAVWIFRHLDDLITTHSSHWQPLTQQFINHYPELIRLVRTNLARLITLARSNIVVAPIDPPLPSAEAAKAYQPWGDWLNRPVSPLHSSDRMWQDFDPVIARPRVKSPGVSYVGRSTSRFYQLSASAQRALEEKWSLYLFRRSAGGHSGYRVVLLAMSFFDSNQSIGEFLASLPADLMDDVCYLTLTE